MEDLSVEVEDEDTTVRILDTEVPAREQDGETWVRVRAVAAVFALDPDTAGAALARLGIPSRRVGKPVYVRASALPEWLGRASKLSDAARSRVRRYFAEVHQAQAASSATRTAGPPPEAWPVQSPYAPRPPRSRDLPPLPAPFSCPLPAGHVSIVGRRLEAVRDEGALYVRIRDVCDAVRIISHQCQVRRVRGARLDVLRRQPYRDRDVWIRTNALPGFLSSVDAGGVSPDTRELLRRALDELADE